MCSPFPNVADRKDISYGNKLWIYDKAVYLKGLLVYLMESNYYFTYLVLCNGHKYTPSLRQQDIKYHNSNKLVFGQDYNSCWVKIIPCIVSLSLFNKVQVLVLYSNSVIDQVIPVNHARSGG